MSTEVGAVPLAVSGLVRAATARFALSRVPQQWAQELSLITLGCNLRRVNETGAESARELRHAIGVSLDRRTGNESGDLGKLVVRSRHEAAGGSAAAGFDSLIGPAKRNFGTASPLRLI